MNLCGVDRGADGAIGSSYEQFHDARRRNDRCEGEREEPGLGHGQDSEGDEDGGIDREGDGDQWSGSAGFAGEPQVSEVDRRIDQKEDNACQRGDPFEVDAYGDDEHECGGGKEPDTSAAPDPVHFGLGQLADGGHHEGHFRGTVERCVDT